MLNLTVRNVNHALPLMLQHFDRDRIHVLELPSRNGPTLEWSEPVCTTYIKPMERVLFSPERDANPFFHLFESMWILAGRRDVAFLSNFLPRIADYSDDGRVFHGAYGYRTRVLYGDQLRKAATLLIQDPTTRRAVVGIWNASHDLAAESLDIPCNTTLAFRMRRDVLDLTVYNRSNDVIWGAYGANAVQFAFILEYVAALVGCHPGRYYQISNAFHVYKNQQWEKLHQLNPSLTWDPYEAEHFRTEPAKPIQFDFKSPLEWMPMCDFGVQEFDYDLTQFFDVIDRNRLTVRTAHQYTSTWVKDVLLPAALAFECYRIAKRDHDQKLLEQAIRTASKVAAPDWNLAMMLWLSRRKV